MKGQFESANRQEPPWIFSVKPIDQIFEQPHMQPPMFQKSPSDTTVVQPLAYVAGEVPLANDHYNKQDDHRDYHRDHDVERKRPRLVEMKCSEECYGTEYKENACDQAVENIFRCYG